MGIPLPKPVLTQIQERHGNAMFRCGSSCVNGYRDSMEDAHLVYLKETWGFFGVFDGHVNDACSAYLETAWRDAIEKEGSAIPITDERLKELALQIDQTWMDTGREGGSTGTFFFAYKDPSNASKATLQVGNVGDSRVIACIAGECKPMTEDHKPNNEGERMRIEDCGGRVENNRVDGSLAVSRAFGDRDYKTNRGGQLEQKVIALADVTRTTVTLNAGDFAILCCDGVFEGNFSNEEVIEFIKEQLQTSDDLPEIAGRVCEEAIERGSRDNISCVIVQFKNGTDYASEPHHKVIAGPFSAPKNTNFRKAYQLMADKAGVSIGALLEQRYDAIAAIEDKSELSEDEVNFFAVGPGDDLKGEERTAFFTDLYSQVNVPASGNSEYMERIQHLQQQVGVPLPILLSLIREPGEQ